MPFCIVQPCVTTSQDPRRVHGSQARLEGRKALNVPAQPEAARAEQTGLQQSQPGAVTLASPRHPRLEPMAQECQALGLLSHSLRGSRESQGAAVETL